MRPEGSDISPLMPAICPIWLLLPLAPESIIMRMGLVLSMCSTMLSAMALEVSDHRLSFCTRYSSEVRMPMLYSYFSSVSCSIALCVSSCFSGGMIMDCTPKLIPLTVAQW
ncbi:MAG: hypothetical protein BWY99_01207 [Synergistetes bacterium ADurb.BinA166]|nr:MAG: hypothetical protein BWY99_01207 [Synergistetes bacterium ADurb.BinA166]